MPHIRLDDKEIELSVGELRIGTGDAGGVRIDSREAQGDFAIISVDPRGTATVRRAATGATILVNGVALGAEPAPLLHGDRIEVAGRQLRFSDDRKAGSTVLMPAFGAPSSAAPATNRTRASGTGGRVVSLVDGREYGVPQSGLRIGRDAGCDIVVPGDSVSRQHAEIAVTSAGYFVRDLSANGIFVNGARAGDAQLLRRGDVIRVGTEEFRFYADAVAAPRLAAPTPALLATLEVVDALTSKPTRFDIRGPLTNVGRATHNDVVVSDESVSDVHATLQRREEGWYLTDLNSATGTYVAGKRIQKEARLDSNAAVRFGGVKVIFREARPIVASRHAGAGEPVEPKRGVSALVWIAAAAVVGATLLFVIQDR
jgi:pSer/pThr/pTyr-binding forkhead associated (FHA) protein